MRGWKTAALAAIGIGALMTLGDWLWAMFVSRHRVLLGLIHGLVLCGAIGGVLAGLSGRAGFGVAWGAVAGLTAAAGFYALAPLLGWSAMFPMWMAFWLAFAELRRRVAQPRPSPRETVTRGLAAAVLSGLAFYLVADMWTKPAPGGPDYARALVSWSFAFLPGFVALLVDRPSPEA